MHVLEARFHSRAAEDDGFVVVGRVFWTDSKRTDEPLVLPSETLSRDPGPDALLTKLRYIVSVAAAGLFDRVRSLRSRFWTFIDVSADLDKEAPDES